jgi:hypothetical protein
MCNLMRQLGYNNKRLKKIEKIEKFKNIKKIE